MRVHASVGQCVTVLKRRSAPIVLAALLACAASLMANLVWMSATAESRGLASPERAWLRETSYLAWQNINFRLVEAKLPYEPSEQWKARLKQFPDGTVSEDAIKVLVLGNSFSLGYALADLDAAWPRQLEHSLNHTLGHGAAQVFTWGTFGADPADYAEWMRQGFTGAEFDAVVVAVTADDADNIRERVLADQADYTQEMNAVFQAAGDVPVVVFNPCLSLQGCSFLKSTPQKWRQEGRDFIATPATDAFMAQEGFESWRYESTPKSAHPGYGLGKVFADDVTQALLEVLPPETIARSRNTTTPKEISLIGSYLPAALSVLTAGSQTLVSYWGAGPVSPQDGLGSAGQAVACMPLGKPHARVTFDPHVPEGTPLTVTLRTGPEAEVAIFGYTDDGEEKILPPTPLAAGATVDMLVGGEQARGLLIASTQPCPTDSPVDMPAFSVLLEVGQTVPPRVMPLSGAKP